MFRGELGQVGNPDHKRKIRDPGQHKHGFRYLVSLLFLSLLSFILVDTCANIFCMCLNPLPSPISWTHLHTSFPLPVYVCHPSDRHHHWREIYSAVVLWVVVVLENCKMAGGKWREDVGLWNKEPEEPRHFSMRDSRDQTLSWFPIVRYNELFSS